MIHSVAWMERQPSVCRWSRQDSCKGRGGWWVLALGLQFEFKGCPYCILHPPSFTFWHNNVDRMCSISPGCRILRRYVAVLRVFHYVATVDIIHWQEWEHSFILIVANGCGDQYICSNWCYVNSHDCGSSSGPFFSTFTEGHTYCHIKLTVKNYEIFHAVCGSSVLEI